MVRLQEYQYQGKNLNGEIVKGSIWAESENEVVDRLRRQGILITSLNVNKEKITKSRKKWKNKDVIKLAYQLEMLLNAGLSLRKIMELLTRQTSTLPFGAMRQSIERGQSIGSVLEEQSYPKLAIALVKAGETSGSLGVSFGLIKDLYERKSKYYKKIIGAISYPIFLLFLMAAFFVTAMVVIIPNFKNVFASMHIQVPFFTQCLFTVSDILLNYYGILALSLVGFIAFLIWCYRQEAVKLYVHRMLWLQGQKYTLLACFQYTNLLDVWALLLDSGIPLIESVQLTQDLLGNQYGKKQSLKLLGDLNGGHSFHQALKENYMGTPFVWTMVSIGEESGELAAMLKHCSLYYQSLMDSYVTLMERLLEPLLLVFMGLGVGILVAAVMMPLFTSISALGS